MKVITITRNLLEQFAPMMNLDAVVNAMNPDGIIALGVMEENQACGAIVVELRECAANILSLYVLPEYRRRGFATELMIEAADIAVQVEPVVGFKVEFSEKLDEDNGLLPFFRFCEMELEKNPNMGCYCCSIEDAGKKPIFSKAKEGNIKTYGDLTPAEKNSLLEEPPYYMEYYMRYNQIEPDMSGFITENEEIRACCVFVNTNGELSLEWLRADVDNHLTVISLLQRALEAAKKKYPADTKITIPIINEQSERLMKKLLGNSLVQTEAAWTGTMLFDEE